MAGTSSTVGNSGPFEVVEEMRVIHRQNASVPFQGPKTCREGGLCVFEAQKGAGVQVYLLLVGGSFHRFGRLSWPWCACAF